ncbi:hypothetical protein ACHQM5_003340 [Ranunculus cassubicifolius]
MASPLAFILLFSLITLQAYAQKGKAPAPAPAGPANLTGILDKAGQFTTFLRLLSSTQVANQIENQLNSSDQGLTVLAPTDNAFSQLKPGTLNGLSTQEQVELVLYHVLPKFYNMAMFETVSNPVRTQSTGEDGGAFGLNFTTSASQVNVSSGLVSTTLNTALAKEYPLAVYQVDKVLLPLDLFGPHPLSKASPPPLSTPATEKPKTPSAKASGPATKEDANSAAGLLSGMFVVIGSLFMALL